MKESRFENCAGADQKLPGVAVNVSETVLVSVIVVGAAVTVTVSGCS